MPGLHGLELVRMTRSQSPGTRVVVVSVHVEEAYVRAAIQNGALAFVAKSQSSECLVPAVRRALAGEKYISPPLPESLAN
jgi:DNA-binding NarL/FixJ family response regulator